MPHQACFVLTAKFDTLTIIITKIPKIYFISKKVLLYDTFVYIVLIQYSPNRCSDIYFLAILAVLS